MKIIICGAGQVGWQIARHLAHDDNDVTVVDNDIALVRRATDTLDVQGVAGHASYPEILDRAGAGDADMIIAATHSDEVNMVTCQVAHSVFEVPRKIARLRAQSYLNTTYSDLYRQDHLPIDVLISPEREVARAALRRLYQPQCFESEPFLDGKVELLGLQLGEECPVVYTPLRQLTDLFSTLAVMVVGIRRDGQLFAPKPGDQLFPGDSIYIVTRTEDVDRTLEVFGKEVHSNSRVVIVGGGNVGLTVARKLERASQPMRARMIERNRARAEYVADELSRTIVLNGDGMDPQLLAEAHIADADAVLCVTDDDNANLLTSVRAKQLGAKMAVCLSNDPSLEALIHPLGIDAYINPRALTVSSIMRHVRQARIEQIYTIGDAEAELISARVLNTSPLCSSLIRDVDLPEGVIIAAILRQGRALKPTGGTRIAEGDTVLVFAMSEAARQVEALFQVKIDFF